MKRPALILSCLLSAVSAHATYSGYQYQRIFSILHAKVPNTDQTNFPVLISTTDTTLATVANSGHLQNSSGFDLIFSTMSDCSYLLNWDTETYSASTGNIIVWVKHPMVLTASDTLLYMCYGNSGITTYQGISTATWDSNYIAVHHARDNAASTTVSDATTNGLNGTANRNTSATFTSGGEVGGAQNLNGTSDYWKDSNAGGQFNLSASAFTIEVWIKDDTAGTSLAGAYHRIVSVRDGPASKTIELGLGGNPNIRQFYIFNNSTGFNPQVTTPDQNLATGFHHVAATFDGASTYKVHLDGAQSSGGTNTLGITTLATTGSIFFGQRGDGARYTAGILDEVRVSKVARSSDWIAAEYNNQFSVSTFMTMGPETQTAGAATGNAFWFGGS